MSTLSLTLPRRYQPLHCMVGFFFAFRLCITFLWFQGDPQVGSTLTILCDLVLFACALFSRVGGRSLKPRGWLRIRTLRWVFAFLGLSLASIFWSSSRSPMATLLYWAAMAAEVFTVLLMKDDPEEDAAAIMGGFVWGASVVAVVAWFSPALPDLRLGNEDFLNPNGLGLQFAMASLCAQLLAARAGYWKWLSIGLAITLLRTISKTSIVAYLAAETLYLVWGSHITRKAKLGIVAMAVIVIGLFSALLEAYFEIYTTTGNQVETLTGRTWVWATALSMAVERPLLGYGIYSFRATIPAFGDFQPWHAHNEILQQFFEYGLVGLVIMVGIYWSFYRSASRSEPGPLRTFSLAILLFALLHGVADTVAFDFSLPLWLFAALSIIFAAQRSSRGSV